MFGASCPSADLVKWVLRPVRRRPRARGRDFRHRAPDLFRVETVSVIRRQFANGALTSAQGKQRDRRSAEPPHHRLPDRPLLRRAWELRDNATACHPGHTTASTEPGVPPCPLWRSMSSANVGPCRRPRPRRPGDHQRELAETLERPSRSERCSQPPMWLISTLAGRTVKPTRTPSVSPSVSDDLVSE